MYHVWFPKWLSIEIFPRKFLGFFKFSFCFSSLNSMFCLCKKQFIGEKYVLFNSPYTFLHFVSIILLMLSFRNGGKEIVFFFVYFSAVASLLAAVCIFFPKKFLFPNYYGSSLQVFGSWVCIFFSLLTLFLTYNDRLI